MSLPQISVVVPVYNVAKYLQQCIDSLMAQTILDKLELIFVNDASPDNCIEILRENEKKHPDKIKVIDSKENLCQGGARNLGMRQARGEYIGFVDSDDFVAPTMYERLYDKAVSSAADATFIQYAYVSDETKYEVLPTHEYLKCTIGGFTPVESAASGAGREKSQGGIAGRNNRLFGLPGGRSSLRAVAEKRHS